MRGTDAALLIVALMIAWSFYRAHKQQDFVFNVFDLVLENGHVSRIACVFLGSWAVSSWVIIRITLDGKMTDVLYAAYGATWAVPIIAKLFSPPPAPGTVTTTAATSTTTKTVEKPKGKT